MSEFIKLKIDYNRCLGIEKCGRCIEVCPVDIFFSSNQFPTVFDENEDECTLCYICLQSCNVNAITLQKTYEL